MVTYPLNNIQYTAEDAELYNSTRTSGVFADDSFNYSVTGADNTIVIGTGVAWIKNGEFSGKVVAQKEALSLNLGLPNANYPRIDAVVIQFNANSNSTEIIVKNGTASSRPSAPAVVRTESVYELHLYHISRNAGELSVSSSNITDLRGNDEYCGIMTDGVTKIDKTLTKDGYVADAKAVGDAISTASASLVPKTRTVNGKSLQNNVSIEAKDVGAAPAMESASHKGCYYRTINGLTEWINPPMVLGEEYRTTERYNGKPVYAKVVDIGSLPNEASKTVSHNISNVEDIVDARGSARTTGGSVVFLPSSAGSLETAWNIGVTERSIFVVTNADRTNWQGSVLVKVIKTTD